MQVTSRFDSESQQDGWPVSPLACAVPREPHTVCAWCGHVRDRRGRWCAYERAAIVPTPASHGICPECQARVEREELAS